MRLDLVGGSALSPFRLNNIAGDLNIDASLRSQLRCQNLYLVECSREISEEEFNRLGDLLDHGSDHPIRLENTPDIYITPRKGTQSPWGTKALAVASEAGFDFIDAIERGRVWYLGSIDSDSVIDKLYDPMTESASTSDELLSELFAHHSAEPPKYLDPSNAEAIHKANIEWGCALNEEEIDYLAQYAAQSGHCYSDAELIMFGQVNSEHCRHKIFNGHWTVNGQPKEDSLFGLIKKTQNHTPEHTLIAYIDNGSVVEGYPATMTFVDEANRYFTVDEPSHLVIKVETHNHPTAISAFAGAATGSGGEIRDEGATGIGARPKAGMVGFTTSDLRIDGFNRPWEQPQAAPGRLASPLEIMLEGPIGAASFNNEFGRPGLVGYFRTLEIATATDGMRWGYHKPIMIAGGVGTIRPQHVKKQKVMAGMQLLVLGGPGMRIGMGGGAASSASSEDHRAELDFASVQRSNPEMERRCQEVINHCRSLGDKNPIVMIHDVGAGGLSNALPELVESGHCGAIIELESIPIADTSLSPAEIWCNESQERYVLALKESDTAAFLGYCARERCPVAVVGRATEEESIIVRSTRQGSIVNLPSSVLFQDPPSLEKNVQLPTKNEGIPLKDKRSISEIIDDVLTVPSVASKRFLVTIGDRSIGGQVHRDQMVGPWQVPVADCAITLADFHGYSGEAMSIGERPLVAINNPGASVRVAIAEAITNLLAAPVEDPRQIKLSANWMAATGDNHGDAALRIGVEAASDFCIETNLAIPVGKDSLSMKVNWDDGAHSVTSPLSLVVTAFTPIKDVRRSLTPLLADAPSKLYLIDLSAGRNRVGATALAQSLAMIDGETADIDPSQLNRFIALMGDLHTNELLSAYHDKGDGGLLVSIVEMMFASRLGVDLNIDALTEQADPRSVLFNEEVGVIVQVLSEFQTNFNESVRAHGLANCVYEIGTINNEERLQIHSKDALIYSAPRSELEDRWHLMSWNLQRLRDEPINADQEREAIGLAHAGLYIKWPHDKPRPAPMVNTTPARVAILRDSGVNSHQEMAAAFMAAGFEAIDVPTSDIRDGRQQLEGFQGIVACGGFSYGDVLGAGLGWAKSILNNPNVRAQFERFFSNETTFALGVCNGCQMFSGLRSIITGTDHWPDLYQNRSEQFEGRTSMVQIPKNNSVLFADLAGAELPIAVAHGEGRMDFGRATNPSLKSSITMRYIVDGSPTVRYPFNPNGSVAGITGLCDDSGRINMVMPHPERNFRMLANSYIPNSWKSSEYGPWMELFLAAKRFTQY